MTFLFASVVSTLFLRAFDGLFSRIDQDHERGALQGSTLR
jgi:hypothetical protein